MVWRYHGNQGQIFDKITEKVGYFQNAIWIDLEMIF